MSFFWHYVMDPKFHLDIVDYTVHGNQAGMHWHDYLQITICTDGTGKFLFTNKEYTVEKGDVFIVSNFENHVAISESGQTTHFLMIIFMPDFIAAPGGRKFDFEYLAPFRYNTKTFNHRINQSLVEAQCIGNLAHSLKSIYSKKEQGYKHMLDAGLRQILATLIRYYKTTYSDYCSVNSRSQSMMRDAIHYIHQNFLNNLTLQDVSDHLHISTSRFRHVFKETFNIGFKEYITYLRLGESRRLLLTTDYNITEVSNRSCFSNIHQFYKVFNKYVFMSPAQYRKRFARPHSAAANKTII